MWAGRILTSLTIAQAIHRDLDAGETRVELVRKVVSAMKKTKWHGDVHPIIGALFEKIDRGAVAAPELKKALAKKKYGRRRGGAVLCALL